MCRIDKTRMGERPKDFQLGKIMKSDKGSHILVIIIVFTMFNINIQLITLSLCFDL